jgi:NADH dehydrogenase [ubiquinone] 1 alpha subcomplex assembly factor 7
MMGLWYVLTWREFLKSRQSFHLVELGPGRGTLAFDILRTLKRFTDVYSALKQVDLVETSPALRLLQSETLGCTLSLNPNETTLAIQQAITSDGIPVNWYSSIDDLPKGRVNVMFIH